MKITSVYIYVTCFVTAFVPNGANIHHRFLERCKQAHQCIVLLIGKNTAQAGVNCVLGAERKTGSLLNQVFISRRKT